jgi:hypothetical protein
MKTIYSIFLLAILPFGDTIAQCTNPPGQPGPVTGFDPACPGMTSEFTIAPVPDATSYVWTVPGGWSGTSTSISLNVIVGSAAGAISVAAVNACGTSPAQVYNATVHTAVVSPQGPVDICATNAPVMLIANSALGPIYQWFNGTTPISGATSISYNATTSGSYSVQVASNNCMIQTAPITVTVTPVPTITASTSGTGCAGIQLDFLGTSSSLGSIYNWTGPNNFPNTQNPSIPSASPSDGGTYTLTVTDGPCVATATVSVVIYQSAPLTPSAISGPQEVCAYQSGNIYEVTDDPNAALYNWTISNDWSGSSLTHSIHTSAGLAGNHDVTVTAENGCGVSPPSTLNVTVHPLPQPVITQSGNTLTVTPSFPFYQWYSGTTSAIPGATAQSYTPTQPGTYSVVVTSNAGCIGQSTLFTTGTAVTTVNKESSINLYPNPNTGCFTIEGAFVSNDGKANISIVDVAGRIVQTQEVFVNNGTFSAHIDMNSAFAAGVYTIKVSSDAANAVIPFVKN